MKKLHYFIWLLMILTVSSCNNSDLEDDIDTSKSTLATKSAIISNTGFLNIEKYVTAFGDMEVTGEIFTVSDADYTFNFVCDRKPGVKYAVFMYSVGDYHVLNGYSEVLTVRLPQGRHLFRLDVIFSTPFQDAQARFLITKINGKGISGNELGFPDLVALGSSGQEGNGTGSNPIGSYHWKCNACGFQLNSVNTNNCLSCNTRKGNLSGNEGDI